MNVQNEFNMCERSCDCHIQIGGSGNPCPWCVKENCNYSWTQNERKVSE